MSWPIETIADLEACRERVRTRHYGVIETAGGVFVSLRVRPWPKLVSLLELWPLGPRYHCRGKADRCLLYYNQPRRMPNFLALRYVVSTPGTSYRTFRAALVALDMIAALKRTDAIVCDASNLRLSDRLMARLGWQPHRPQRWHRNFIRRFYGEYPPSAATLLGGRTAATPGEMPTAISGVPASAAVLSL